MRKEKKKKSMTYIVFISHLTLYKIYRFIYKVIYGKKICSYKYLFICIKYLFNCMSTWPLSCKFPGIDICGPLLAGKNIFEDASNGMPTRDVGRIEIKFTPRVFPTPVRESQSHLEDEVSSGSCYSKMPLYHEILFRCTCIYVILFRCEAVPHHSGTFYTMSFCTYSGWKSKQKPGELQK